MPPDAYEHQPDLHWRSATQGEPSGRRAPIGVEMVMGPDEVEVDDEETEDEMAVQMPPPMPPKP
jgi:hypothetical protein